MYLFHCVFSDVNINVSILKLPNICIYANIFTVTKIIHAKKGTDLITMQNLPQPQTKLYCIPTSTIKNGKRDFRILFSFTYCVIGKNSINFLSWRYFKIIVANIFFPPNSNYKKLNSFQIIVSLQILQYWFYFLLQTSHFMPHQNFPDILEVWNIVWEYENRVVINFISNLPPKVHSILFHKYIFFNWRWGRFSMLIRRVPLYGI